MTVTPDYEFLVGDSLREEFSNGRSYYGLNGSTIAVPSKDGAERFVLKFYQPGIGFFMCMAGGIQLVVRRAWKGTQFAKQF